MSRLVVEDPLSSVLRDSWRWEHGQGGGLSIVVTGGTFWEKAAVNISGIHGEISKDLAKTLKIPQVGKFSACGLSLIFHPISPHVPTVHLNVRYFETDRQFWIGGGVDLTPYYPYEQDFQWFHQQMQRVCDGMGEQVYFEYKKRCDEYFFLPHRLEMRGIGGIFFDHLEQPDFLTLFVFLQDVATSLPNAYFPIVAARKQQPVEQAEKDFQLFRRGRYVEFNLLYDRGTLFGLQTKGRAESILVSLPPTVWFPYNYQPAAGSPQEKMLSYYQPKDWVNLLV